MQFHIKASCGILTWSQCLFSGLLFCFSVFHSKEDVFLPVFNLPFLQVSLVLIFSYLFWIFWKQIQAMPAVTQIKFHGSHDNYHCIVTATTLRTQFFEM